MKTFLIDPKGKVWPADSIELARRLNLPCFGGTLAARAVEQHGFIHLRYQEGNAHVAVPIGRFTLSCLAGAMQQLGDLQPSRIIACLHTAEGTRYEMFATAFDFAERAESFEREGGVKIKPFSRIAMPRNLRNLNLPLFAAARPLVQMWRNSRGELTLDTRHSLIAGPFRRIILVRQPVRSSRLLVDHFGATIKMMRPCETLALVGRSLEDMYDEDYARWIVPGYVDTIDSNEPRLQSIIADIRHPDGKIIRARYDRVLLPWHEKGGDRLALCISLLRNRSELRL